MSKSSRNNQESCGHVLVGATLTKIERLPHNYWVFHFGEGVCLNVEAPWRLISRDSIVVTREDDGQKFGLPEPVDAESVLRHKVEGHLVTAAEMNPASSDLTLRFDHGLVLEIVNLSSGYECWTLNTKTGSVIVGRNGIW